MADQVDRFQDSWRNAGLDRFESQEFKLLIAEPSPGLATVFREGFAELVKEAKKRGVDFAQLGVLSPSSDNFSSVFAASADFLKTGRTCPANERGCRDEEAESSGPLHSEECMAWFFALQALQGSSLDLSRFKIFLAIPKGGKPPSYVLAPNLYGWLTKMTMTPCPSDHDAQLPTLALLFSLRPLPKPSASTPARAPPLSFLCSRQSASSPSSSKNLASSFARSEASLPPVDRHQPSPATVPMQIDGSCLEATVSPGQDPAKPQLKTLSLKVSHGSEILTYDEESALKEMSSRCGLSLDKLNSFLRVLATAEPMPRKPHQLVSIEREKTVSMLCGRCSTRVAFAENNVSNPKRHLKTCKDDSSSPPNGQHQPSLLAYARQGAAVASNPRAVAVTLSHSSAPPPQPIRHALNAIVGKARGLELRIQFDSFTDAQLNLLLDSVLRLGLNAPSDELTSLLQSLPCTLAVDLLSAPINTIAGDGWCFWTMLVTLLRAHTLEASTISGAKRRNGDLVPLTVSNDRELFLSLLRQLKAAAMAHSPSCASDAHRRMLDDSIADLTATITFTEDNPATHLPKDHWGSPDVFETGFLTKLSPLIVWSLSHDPARSFSVGYSQLTHTNIIVTSKTSLSISDLGELLGSAQHHARFAKEHFDLYKPHEIFERLPVLLADAVCDLGRKLLTCVHEHNRPTI